MKEVSEGTVFGHIGIPESQRKVPARMQLWPTAMPDEEFLSHVGKTQSIFSVI